MEKALCEFMADVLDVVKRGGRLVVHHMEFDAGIIAKELARCDLNTLVDQWGKIARDGWCTMDPEIGRWVLQCFNQDAGAEATKSALNLRTLVSFLLPDSKAHLAKHHIAGADAVMHLKVAEKLLRLSADPGRA